MVASLLTQTAKAKMHHVVKFHDCNSFIVFAHHITNTVCYGRTDAFLEMVTITFFLFDNLDKDNFNTFAKHAYCSVQARIHSCWVIHPTMCAQKGARKWVPDSLCFV